MSANERRAEIMRILVGCRITTEQRLSRELGVTRQTIHMDIRVLMRDYPIYIVKGRAGGVRLPDWYHLDRRILSIKQITVIKELLPVANIEQRKVLVEMLKEYGGRINLDNVDDEAVSL